MSGLTDWWNLFSQFLRDCIKNVLCALMISKGVTLHWPHYWFDYDSAVNDWSAKRISQCRAFSVIYVTVHGFFFIMLIRLLFRNRTYIHLQCLTRLLSSTVALFPQGSFKIWPLLTHTPLSVLDGKVDGASSALGCHRQQSLYGHCQHDCRARMLTSQV